MQNKSLSEEFVKELTEKIFTIIIEENPKIWIIKKEILKLLNLCMGRVKKTVRNETLCNLKHIYL